MYTNRNIPAPFFSPATQPPQQQTIAENYQDASTAAIPSEPKTHCSSAGQTHLQNTELLALLLLCYQQKNK